MSPTLLSHTEGVSQSLNTLITSLLTQLDNLVGIGRVPYLLLQANYAENVRNRIEGARDNKSPYQSYTEGSKYSFQSQSQFNHVPSA